MTTGQQAQDNKNSGKQSRGRKDIPCLRDATQLGVFYEIQDFRGGNHMRTCKGECYLYKGLPRNYDDGRKACRLCQIFIKTTERYFHVVVIHLHTKVEQIRLNW